MITFKRTGKVVRFNVNQVLRIYREISSDKNRVFTVNDLILLDCLRGETVREILRLLEVLELIKRVDAIYYNGKGHTCRKEVRAYKFNNKFNNTGILANQIIQNQIKEVIN